MWVSIHVDEVQLIETERQLACQREKALKKLREMLGIKEELPVSDYPRMVCVDLVAAKAKTEANLADQDS